MKKPSSSSRGETFLSVSNLLLPPALYVLDVASPDHDPGFTGVWGEAPYRRSFKNRIPVRGSLRPGLPLLQAQFRTDTPRTRNLSAMHLDPRTKLCLSRSVRREVLFARGYGGRNGFRRYRRSINSQYSC